MPHALSSTSSHPTEAMAPIDAQITAAIKAAVKEEMKEMKDELTEVRKSIKEVNDRLAELTSVMTRLGEVELAIEDTSSRLEHATTTILPEMVAHTAKLAEALALQNLQIDVHRRKWNVTIHGIAGAEGEAESVTRKKVLEFAKDALKLEEVDETHFQACHRLGRKKDAGVIVRFCDLGEKDRWMTATSNLKNSTTKFSVTPDLPPVLRPLKDDLMKRRKELPSEVKSKARVRFLPQWPFVHLRIEGQATQVPSQSLAEVTKAVLGFDPIFRIPTIDQ